jgi:hypothetical protein
MEVRDNSERAKWALYSFYAVLALLPISLLSGYLEYQLLTDIIDGSFTDESRATRNDLRQGVIGITQFILFIATVVFFIRWFRRAYFNLTQVGVRTEFQEGWAAGSWFVPFLNLVRPYQIMREIWVETQRALGTNTMVSTRLVGFWWAFFLISNGLDNVTTRMVLQAETPDDIRTGTLLTMGSEIFELIPLLLVILLIRTFHPFEKELFEQNHQVNIEDHLIDSSK